MKIKTKIIVKKIVKSFVLMALFLNLALTINSMLMIHGAFADSTGPQALQDVTNIGNQTGLNSFQVAQHPDAPADYVYSGTGEIGSVVYTILDLVKLFMSSIAVIIIVYMSLKLIFGGSNEESAGKVKKGLGIAIAGLILIQLADVLVKKVFFGENGEILTDKTSAETFAKSGVEQIRGIVGFVQLGLGAVAVLIIVVNGIKIMVSGGEEETRKKALKNIGISLGGLVIVLLSELLVKAFAFPKEGTSLPSAEIGKGIIVMITNYISGFVAIISFVVLLYAGYMYVAAGSEEQTKDKVKRLITGAILGIILSFGAYAIANTLITFKEPTEFSTEKTTIDATVKTQ